MQKTSTKHLLRMRCFLLFSPVLLLMGHLPALGQTRLVPPATDNAAWADSVHQLSLPQQVAAVRARAWRDTLWAPYQPALCRGLLPATALQAAPALTTPLPTPAKPRGFPFIYVVNGEIFYNNDAATIGKLQQRLATKPIRQVTLLLDAAAAAIYGARAANGVVVLSGTKPTGR